MESERGTHFDPALLDLFFSNLDAIDAVREAHAERDELAAI